MVVSSIGVVSVVGQLIDLGSFCLARSAVRPEAHDFDLYL